MNLATRRRRVPAAVSCALFALLVGCSGGNTSCETTPLLGTPIPTPSPAVQRVVSANLQFSDKRGDYPVVIDPLLFPVTLPGATAETSVCSGVSEFLNGTINVYQTADAANAPLPEACFGGVAGSPPPAGISAFRQFLISRESWRNSNRITGDRTSGEAGTDFSVSYEVRHTSGGVSATFPAYYTALRGIRGVVTATRIAGNRYRLQLTDVRLVQISEQSFYPFEPGSPEAIAAQAPPPLLPEPGVTPAPDATPTPTPSPTPPPKTLSSMTVNGEIIVENLP